MRIIFFLFIINLLWSEGSVDITVDRRRINEGDSISLTITAMDVSGSPDVILPNIPDFKVISGPNQSSSTNVQFVNGEMTKNTTTILTWTLIPNKTGQLEIPIIFIKIGKKTFQSKPIRISVNKRGKGKPGNIAKFFIEAEVDNSNPFRGEQVTLTYTLYTQVDVTSFDDEMPKFKGFWTEEIFSPKNLNLREIQKNEVLYYAATIKKIALFPTKSGAIQIDPMVAVIGIREKQQRWNDFSLFGPPSKKFTVSTNALSLNVIPLPENNDGNMSAVVGNWKIKSIIGSTNLKQDEAVTFKIIVSGTGNIQIVDLTDISFPNELEVFEPEVQINDNSLMDKIGGEKQFEWVLIPRFSGDIYLPQLFFSYFDPKIEQWMSQSTPRYHLHVAPNEKITASSIGLSKEEVILMAEDIRFIDESAPNWRDRNKGLISSSALTFLLLSGMILIFPKTLNFSKKMRNANYGNRQSRRALKSALVILDSNDGSPEEIYSRIYNAIVIFINQKLGYGKVEYSNGEILDLFKNHNLNKICPQLEKILLKIEAERFSPISNQDAEIDLGKIKELFKDAHRGWN